MDLYNELNNIWINCTWLFITFFYVVFIVCLVYQHFKNKKTQVAILKQHQRNLEILQDLKNRF